MKLLVSLLTILLCWSLSKTDDLPHISGPLPESGYEFEYIEDDQCLDRKSIDQFTMLLRHVMRNGLPFFDFQTLDPLECPPKSLQIHDENVDLDVNISEMTVKRLSSFEVTDMKIIYENVWLEKGLTPLLSLELQLRLPKLLAEGFCAINGSGHMMASRFDREGNISINVTDLHLMVLPAFGYMDNILQLVDLHLDCQWDNWEVKFTNFTGKGMKPELVQMLIQKTFKKMYEYNKEEYMQQLSTFSMEKLNKLLRNQTVVDGIESGIRWSLYLDSFL